jgi:hypothetical protein
MRFRFLYLTEAGEEVEVGGLEELRACVAMGRVDENTLLFDAVTREWAPARAHSAYRLLAEEISGPAAGLGLPGDRRSTKQAAPEAPDEAEDSGADAPEPKDILGVLPDEGPREPPPKLEPVDVGELPDPQALFVEREARQRRLRADEPTAPPRRDADFHVVERSDELASQTLGGSKAERSSASVGEPTTSAPEPELFEARSAPPPEEDLGEIAVPRIRTSRPPAPIRRRPVGRRRRHLLVVAGAAVVVVGLWSVLGDDGPRARDLPAATSGDGPPPASGGAMADAFAAAQGSAFEDMVHAMDSLRATHDVLGGPQGWLDGHYLATASEYPHVEAYWHRYRAFVSELRSSDTALFRTGFVRRLRQDGHEGPVLAVRLAGALEDFRASQPARDSLYQGMDSLAARALALHALLVEREAEVEYDPVRLGTVSRDPVMEAFPSNPELRDEIWARLDGIFEAMDVVQGGVPGSRDQLTDAVLREIRDSPERH